MWDSESDQKPNWWKEGFVYQIYPRSFCDSNGDGIGDIPGIISKLDYLQELGVSIIWLSPVYCSPNYDNGYDISDYFNINPEFGTMADMKKLISKAKSKGIRIVMDLVINHTSFQHSWFKESRKSLDNPYRDYYIWAKTPNNWTSFFTGSVWEYDEQTNEYYMHLFSKEQPDLNYKNPKVIEEVKKILKFWLDLGIAGFRCDVINVIYKTSLENGKKRMVLTGSEHYLSQEGCHKILHELRTEVLDKYDCFTVGETALVDTDMANDLCKKDRQELDMVFAFEHLDADCSGLKWFPRNFDVSMFKRVLCKWQTSLEWNANFLENHDQGRSVSRFGDENTYHSESAKMLATLLFTLRGTPFIFEGEEIGMTNGDFNSLDDIEDVETHNISKMLNVLPLLPSVRWNMLRHGTRDNARTPMQWNDSVNAGFSSTKPWLRVNNNYHTINVDKQINNPDSILSFYKKLIKFRKENPVLINGDFTEIPTRAPVFAYKRQYDGKSCVIMLNFSSRPVVIAERLQTQLHGRAMLFGNYKHAEEDSIVELKAREAIIFGDK